MFANLKTILAGIQVISALITQLKDWYDAYQLKQVEKHYKKKKTAVELINKKLVKELEKGNIDDEIIKDLHRRLNNITGK